MRLAVSQGNKSSESRDVAVSASLCWHGRPDELLSYAKHEADELKICAVIERIFRRENLAQLLRRYKDEVPSDHQSGVQALIKKLVRGNGQDHALAGRYQVPFLLPP